MSMTVIEHIEVGSGGAASITFSSIPTDGTYTDLYLVLSGRTTETNIIDFLDVYPNGSTSNLSSQRLSGSGSSASSAANSRNYINASTSTSNTFANLELYIPNYASSNAKSISLNSVSENNAASAYQNIQGTLWDDTTAISSLELNPVYGNFVQYSSATLYGITAGSI